MKLVTLFYMFELVIAVLLGCITGIFTGLIPGLHTNTVAVLVLIGSSILLGKFSFIVISSFLIAMIVVHSFIDYIPSIFLGAPESSTALSVLPGHKLLQEGQGFIALKYTVVGGISGFVVTVGMLPLLFILINSLREFVSNLAAPILLVLSVFFILSEVENQKVVWALIIYLLSGTLGLIVLNGLHIKQSLFPMLSGLFGLSVLMLSLASKIKIPKQFISYETNVFSFKNLVNGFKALLAGGFMGLIPTLGPSQAAVVAQGMSGFNNPKQFLTLLGGINTVDTLFTLTTLYVIGKARSGVLTVVRQIGNLTFSDYSILLMVAITALGIAVYSTIKIGRLFANNINRIPYKPMSLSIILFITVLVGVLSGVRGLAVLVVATAIGMLSQLVGVRKIHAMGVLSLPVILSYTI